MRVLLTGLSHHTAPVEVREKLAFSEPTLPAALDTLRGLPGVDEALILSTCNRVEVTVAVGDQPGSEQRLIEFLSVHSGFEPAWLAAHLYHFQDRDAIRHLFRVAASLDSMVLGEPQILGQMKAAYAEAKAHGAVNGFLDAVMTRAFSVAKRVRSETEIGKSAVSVSYAAVELARQIFGNLMSTRVLLIGAGKMSELAARHLHRSGCAKIYVTNRTLARAEEVAEAVDGEVIPYDTFHARLPEIDIVVASSGATDYLLRKDEVRRVLSTRRSRPMFLIDIAVPRNIEPAVNELEHAFLYDIDDLGSAVAENRKARQKEAREAEQIIEEEIRRLDERLRAREVTPAIVELQQRLERLAQSEMERLRPKFGVLSPQQEEALAQYTRSLMNKVAHGPITELRRAASHSDPHRVIEIIRRVFRIEDSGNG
ncbi:MAG: glutamyl-tRNA reductase [Bryobacterales bacterium]|nr:glutamyl-tRNA reductase [Bryobacterales bacterium]